MAQMTGEQAETTLAEGQRAINRVYQEDVQEMAQWIYNAMQEDDSLDRDETLHETVDGSQWVIYTGKAILVQYCTDNDEARTELGPEAFADRDSGDINWPLMAYLCMRADVDDALQALER